MKKFMIKVNGTQYEVEVEEVNEVTSDTPVIHEEKVQAPIQASPTQKSPTKKESDLPLGASKLTAPMPGTVLKVNVNMGDRVKKGQVLLILEAMKMENEIVAPADGTVASVNVSKGTSVNAGDVLMSLS